MRLLAVIGKMQARNAPGALAAMGALLMPGVSARMLQDAPTVVRGMADTLGGAYPGNPTERGMFAGMKAKTVDMDKAQKFRDNELADMSPTDNWEQTGFMRGIPGEAPELHASGVSAYPRWEIDDSAAEYHPGRVQSNILGEGDDLDRAMRLSAMNNDGWQANVGEVLDHPELYKAYPQLAGKAFRVVPDAKWKHENAAAVWEGDGLSVRASLSPRLTTGKSILLHELQHGVQDIEGFARGASNHQFGNQWDTDRLVETDAALDVLSLTRGHLGIDSDQPFQVRDKERLHAAYMKAKDDYEKLTGTRPEKASGGLLSYRILESDPELFEESLRHNKKTHAAQIAKNTEANKWIKEEYHNSAGEVEARNTEKRMDMDAARRRDLPPDYTADVDRKKQIAKRYVEHVGNAPGFRSGQ